MKRKEIIWLFATLVLALILNVAIFGIDRISNGSTFVFNVYDTYIVIKPYLFTIPIAVFAFLGVYLVRTLRSSFKNLTANIILMIALVLISWVLLTVHSLLEPSLGWTIHAPNGSGDPLAVEPPAVISSFAFLSNTILVFHLLILTSFAYCGFKTIKNYKNNNKY